MRSLFFVFLMIVSALTYADEITCYSAGKLIYHASIQDFTVTPEGYYAFIENKQHYAMLINADCIIKLTTGD